MNFFFKHSSLIIIILVLRIDKINKTAKFIDVAHPNNHNLNTSFTNKITKYKDLADQIKAMWQMNTVQTIQKVISANGLVHQNQFEFSKVLNIPKFIINKIKKSVILETCRIVRKIMNIND
jgi:hypothetical protein